MEITVSTKDELKEAMDKKYSKIIVIGELASDLKKASVIRKLSAPAITALGLAIASAVATAPATGGSSFAALKLAAPAITAETGVGIPAIIAVSSIGISLIIALFKNYNFKFKKLPDGTMEAEFSRK